MKKEEIQKMLEVVKRHSTFIELADGRWLLQTNAAITNKEIVSIFRRYLSGKEEL